MAEEERSGEDAAAALAERVADYLEGRGHRFDAMTKREAVIAAVRVLTDDIGAAQHFCQTIGLDVDLYTADLSHIGSNRRPS